MSKRTIETNRRREIVERETPSDANRLLKELLEFGKLILACAIFMFVVLNFITRPLVVSGNSMVPTLENRNIALYNVFSGKFLSIDRYDVVVVKHEETGDHWVKRVIGLPGDTIAYRDGRLTLNGEVVPEPYAITGGDTYRDDWDFQPVVLGEDEYWLMGDNRNHSADSRVVGAFKRSDIVGNGLLVLFPFSSMGIVSGV